jgi:outer membrane protein assembly factor BamB
LGSFDRYLHAIEIGSNASMWRFPEEEPAGNWFWASPVVNEGIVYAGCLDGKLYAIEGESGEELWGFDCVSAIISSPVLMDSLLIIIDESGTLHVFDISTELGNEAAPVKTISIGASVRSSFYAQDGLVFTRGEDNWLYVVDIDRGSVSWRFDLGEKEE